MSTLLKIVESTAETAPNDIIKNIKNVAMTIIRIFIYYLKIRFMVLETFFYVKPNKIRS